MNLLGNLGDPEKVAKALQPLIEGAEDKALAELQASLSVVVSSLQSDVSAVLDTIQRELQDTRIVIVEQMTALREMLPGLVEVLVKTAVQEMQKTTITIGRG